MTIKPFQTRNIQDVIRSSNTESATRIATALADWVFGYVIIFDEYGDKDDDSDAPVILSVRLVEYCSLAGTDATEAFDEAMGALLIAQRAVSLPGRKTSRKSYKRNPDRERLVRELIEQAVMGLLPEPEKTRDDGTEETLPRACGAGAAGAV